MAFLQLTTMVTAPPERCFDLSRSVDLHVDSMSATGERAVAGRTSGLLELGEQVTWRGRHFGLMHEHEARITAMDRPRHFRDEMVRGRFRRFRHDHHFEPVPGGTRMVDEVAFESPGRWLGRLVDRFVLTGYLTKLLTRRNEVIRRAAETAENPP